MAFDALRGYMQLANGLSDVTRQRALQAAKQMLDQGGDVVDLAVSTATSAGVARQVQALAEDLLATSRTNRDLMIGLVRTEVERAVAHLGLVGADELAAMTRVVDRLQSQLDAAIAFGGDLMPSGSDSARAREAAAASRATAAKSASSPDDRPRKKVPAKKVPAKKAAVKKAAVKKAAVKKAAVKKAAVKKAAVKKSVANKSVAKKAPAKKVVAKKSAGPA
jgi:hypothetical protein